MTKERVKLDDLRKALDDHAKASDWLERTQRYNAYFEWNTELIEEARKEEKRLRENYYKLLDSRG
jgi:hypothetical protein